MLRYILLFVFAFELPITCFGQANQEFIFVHGLGGSSNGTWGNSSHRNKIIQDYRPSKSFSIDYDSWDYTPTCAIELKNFLNLKGYSNGIAIVHSKGGLVARKYFQDNLMAEKLIKL